MCGILPLMYTPHPSAELTRLFRERPYQGADPATARFLFVGLDANYAADIEGGPAWAAVRDYHEDGIAFWRRHGVHHPFLLPQYTGDGRRYHSSFSIEWGRVGQLDTLCRGRYSGKRAGERRQSR